MELEEDENVILDEGFWGYRKKLVLTNKRLLVQKGKGLFRLTWKIENEIPLGEIEEAYGMMETFTSLSLLILKLKNKEQVHFNFRLTDSQMPSLMGGAGALIPMEAKAITDKYVTAINHQIQNKFQENAPTHPS